MVEWYLRHHHRSTLNPGFPGMYADRARVGHLAVSVESLRHGDAGALYRALVATVMFQAMRDVFVQRILRRLSFDVAEELASPGRLLALARNTPCDRLANGDALMRCSLAKDPTTKAGTCSTHPDLACYLKRHTELLGRYGHFGRFPTSLALRLREAEVGDLPGLYTAATTGRSRLEAARWLRTQLQRAWRVSDKISAMYLSLVSNPDVLPGAPWSGGLDWREFVVIDTNVDGFLRLIGYEGPWTYRAREGMVRALAHRVRLDELDGTLQRNNPRIVQQAMFMFMSRSNRRDSPLDCSHVGTDECSRCPSVLREACPVRRSGSIYGGPLGRGGHLPDSGRAPG